MTDPSPRLRALLGPVIAAHGLYLEDVAVLASGRRRLVRVTVDLPDGPGGVGSDALTEVSRAVSDALDEADVLVGAYLLEVSTPGTDRPLREPRHYRRALGRIVRVRTRSGERVVGRVVDADDGAVTLDVDGARRRVAFPDLVEGVVDVELRGLEEEG